MEGEPIGAGTAAGLVAPVTLGVLLQFTGFWMAPMTAAAVTALARAARSAPSCDPLNQSVAAGELAHWQSSKTPRSV
jgi:hypothetical protein